MTLFSYRLVAAVAVAFALAAPALAERISLNASSGTSQMSRTFTTSTWPFTPMPDSTIQDWFFQNFKPGLIQVDLGEEVFAKSVSAKDALVRAEEVATFLRRVQDNGGRVMISISKIPPWLSSNPSRANVAQGEGTQIAAASPPADPAQWAQFVQDVVSKFSGLSNLSFRIGWEPDTKVWQGTEQQFFEHYVTTARAIKKVYGAARVGGPGVSDLGPHWRNAQGRPMLEGFLAHVARAKAPLDFVTIHAFSTSPWASWAMYRTQVSELASRAGLPGNIPIFVGEWADRPDPFAAERETPYIAAYLLANLIGMDAAGIVDHSYTSMTEQQVNEKTEFSGGLGMFTRSLIVRPSGLAFKMLERMGNQRLPVTVQDGTVFALAGRRGRSTTLLIANYVPDDTITTKDYVDNLRSQGVLNDQLARSVTNPGQLKSLAEGRSSLKGSAALQSAHEKALRKTDSRRGMWHDARRNNRDITLDITGLPGGGAATLRVMRIDSEHGVPASAAKEINRHVAAARGALNENKLLENLTRSGFSGDDISLLRAFAGAGNKEKFALTLGTEQLRRLFKMVNAINAFEHAAALPVARAALAGEKTGLTVSQEVSIAGQKSLSFDIQMEPNSVVLLEFGD